MARRKQYKRLQPGEHVFTNPREAARKIREFARQGAQVYGTRSAMSAVGIQPHHYIPEKTAPGKKMPDAEAELLADQLDTVAGPVEISYAPTRTSDPSNPRTSGAGYDPATQRLMVEWGDGGTPYYFYDVTAQEWDGFRKAASPGKFINTVLNAKNYGPVDSD